MPKPLARKIKKVEPTAAQVSGKLCTSMLTFARHWNGSIDGTIAACAEVGFYPTRNVACRFVYDPRFIGLVRRKSNHPDEGVWTRQELQQWLTRVAAGIEPDGYEVIIIREAKLECDSDYDSNLGGTQWREVDRRVPKYAKLSDRLKAGEMLGKTLGAFVDKVELTGDLKISVIDLLDDDLSHAKPVLDVAPAALKDMEDILE